MDYHEINVNGIQIDVSQALIFFYSDYSNKQSES